MPPSDDDRSAFFDLLGHDLTTLRRMVSGRAQLLARVVRRSPSLAPGEREKLLHGLAFIEEAMRTQGVMIAALRVRSRAGRNGHMTRADRVPTEEL